MSLEPGPGPWWPLVVPGHAISCPLGPDTVPLYLLLPAWALVPQGLGRYLSCQIWSQTMHPALNCLTQGLRLLWAGAEEGASLPCHGDSPIEA